VWLVTWRSPVRVYSPLLLANKGLASKTRILFCCQKRQIVHHFVHHFCPGISKRTPNETTFHKGVRRMASLVKRGETFYIQWTLRKWLDQYKPRPSVGGWYFPSPQSLTHYDPDNFSRDLRTANENANLAWTCLDYRHALGSQLAMNGFSLYQISAVMGNSPEICRRHYAALTPASCIDSVEFPTMPKQVSEAG
jgi:hypothetical protein